MIPLKDKVPHERTPVVTVLLIAINGLVFLYMLSLSRPELNGLLASWAFIPERYAGLFQEGPPNGLPALIPPLLTSMFLHGGWLHLISNMWILWLFGDNVEDRMGHGRFLVFYLLSGLAATALHLAFALDSDVPTIGASGAIAGVMGAYVLMFPGARIITLIPVFFIPLFVDIPAVIFIGFWFITQLFSGVASLTDTAARAGIAWWAHVGGFAFGAVSLPLFRRGRRGYHKVR
jgi:membrane associated rhomboid family serine protease